MDTQASSEVICAITAKLCGNVASALKTLDALQKKQWYFLLVSQGFPEAGLREVYEAFTQMGSLQGAIAAGNKRRPKRN